MFKKRNKREHEAFKNIRKKKILLTLGMLILYRYITHIPSPFLRDDINALLRDKFLALNLFSGGGFNSLSLMTTGVSSYITASIIIQLLSSSFESLHRLQKMPGGKTFIDTYKRRLAYVLSIISSIGLITFFHIKYEAFGTTNIYLIAPIITAFHLLGCFITIKIADKIESDGLGNGLSFLIFINIISKLPSMMYANSKLFNDNSNTTSLVISLIFILLLFILIIICEKSEARYKVSFAKASIYKNSIYDENKHSYIPFRLNLSGVMPLILAATLMTLISYAYTKLNTHYGSNWILSSNTINIKLISVIINSLLIFIFAFMYTEITVSPIDISENIISRGASFRDIGHGSDTCIFLERNIKSLTWIGSSYLFLVSLVPTVVFYKTNFTSLGITSLMILISVSCSIVDSLDLVKDNR